MMKKIMMLLSAVLMMLTVAGCGAPEAEQPEDQVSYEIAMVTDADMIMDGGYSQVAWTAISEFGADKGVSHKYYKAPEASDEAYMETIDNAVEKGAKLIIADGSSFADVVCSAQKEYKDVKFILIDSEPVDKESGKTDIGDNTAVVMFASEQAGYLAGYSAVKDGKTQLGFIGDEKKSVVMDYGYGFLQGADAAAKETGAAVSVNYRYCTSDDTRESILSTASEWYGAGTEVIFACGETVEQPVIEAAELTDRKVIAAETDKSEMSDTVMTSAVKDIDGVLEELLKQYRRDKFPGGEVQTYNAENDGIWLEMSNGRFAAFSESDYNSVLDTIKDGKGSQQRRYRFARAFESHSDREIAGEKLQLFDEMQKRLFRISLTNISAQILRRRFFVRGSCCEDR